MGCGGLRARLLAASLGALLAAGPAGATDADGRGADRGQPPRLDLGLYGPPYGTPGAPSAMPRFGEWVDVEGAPARGLEDTMAVWWKHFDLGEQAVYGRGYYVDPGAQPNAVNLLPVLQEVYKKLKKH